jgi:hypothetical protein
MDPGPARWPTRLPIYPLCLLSLLAGAPLRSTPDSVSG